MKIRVGIALFCPIYLSGCLFSSGDGYCLKGYHQVDSGTDELLCLPDDAGIDARTIDARVIDAASDAPSTCPACSDATPHCRSSDTTCVECLSNDHCPGAHCEPSSGFCVQCIDSSHCSSAAPQCIDHLCSPCSNNEHCASFSNEPLCNLQSGQCVECISEAHCSPSNPVCLDGACSSCSDHEECISYPDTPLCNTDSGQCVECISDSECPEESPFCDAGSCAPCSNHDHCAARPDTPFCNLASGTCITCRSDNDCSSPDAARCNLETHTCEGCTQDVHCSNVSGNHVCEDSLCVPCSERDESACGPNVCDVQTRSCSDRPAHAKGLCQECISDSECSQGKLCAPMNFQGAFLGHFCLWRKDAETGPNRRCSEVRPYVATQEITSIGRTTAEVCSLRTTTCAALDDFSGPDCDNDSECGTPALDDGLCRQFEEGVNLCTYPCLSDHDCKPGSSCNSRETPNYCDFGISSPDL